MKALTESQRRIGRSIGRCEREGEPAFVPDLARRLGLAGESSLTPTLRILERKGVVAIRGGGVKGRSRVVTLTDRGRQALGFGGLPLLGSIPAGPLSEAVEEAETVLDERALLPWREGDFLLRVSGDSMIGDGILDGDKVLLRPGVEPYAGEIAAVVVGGDHGPAPEATLKHFLPMAETGQVRLRASNPGYRDLVVPGESVRVAGVFRGLIRDGSRPSR